MTQFNNKKAAITAMRDEIMKHVIETGNILLIIEDTETGSIELMNETEGRNIVNSSNKLVII